MKIVMDAPNSPGMTQSRLRWRCRRGMKELDIILLSYLEKGWPQACAEEQQTFEILLNLQDIDLYSYVSGRATAPDEAIQTLLDKIVSLHHD